MSDALSVIARCEGCGYEYLVRSDRTVSLECDCSLRDPDTPWSVVEMVPRSVADDLAAALEAGGHTDPLADNPCGLCRALAAYRAAYRREETP